MDLWSRSGATLPWGLASATDDSPTGPPRRSSAPAMSTAWQKRRPAAVGGRARHLRKVRMTSAYDDEP